MFRNKCPLYARRDNVASTLIQRYIDVETTSCVYCSILPNKTDALNLWKTQVKLLQ